MTNIDTAKEYARRARKGIPEDRWVDGTDGARQVAAGLVWLCAWAHAEIERMKADVYQASVDATEPHADPLRE